MKKLITLVLIALKLTAAAQEAPKGTTQIIIPGVTLKQAMSVLMDEGYSINKYDTTLGFAYSQPKVYKAAQIVIKLRVKDSSLIVSGDFKSLVNMARIIGGVGAEETPYTGIVNRGMRGSILKDSFVELDRVAKSISKDLQYTAEK